MVAGPGSRCPHLAVGRGGGHAYPNGAVFGDSFVNGAESLVRTLIGGGVNVCFANPGTSEMHFVAALDPVEASGARSFLILTRRAAPLSP